MNDPSDTGHFDWPSPMREVEGKVAFITGGSSGIGLGMARAFVNAGMKVVITYRTRSHLDEAMKYLEDAVERVHAIAVDVVDRHRLHQAAEETVERFGKVHVLVNNAGVGILAPLSEATFDDWDWGWSVNVNGVFNGIHAFLPKIKAHGEGGQIVTTASTSALFAGATGGIYTTTKFAVIGMMEALRQELLGSKVGVSVYCPGMVNSNIRHTERNRPTSLSETHYRPEFSHLPTETDTRPPGMDPLEAGERVLRGIRNNDLYILTHPEFEQGMRDRHEALMASLPVGESIPPERVAMERPVLRGPVYIHECDRKSRL